MEINIKNYVTLNKSMFSDSNPSIVEYPNIIDYDGKDTSIYNITVDYITQSDIPPPNNLIKKLIIYIIFNYKTIFRKNVNLLNNSYIKKETEIHRILKAFCNTISFNSDVDVSDGSLASPVSEPTVEGYPKIQDPPTYMDLYVKPIR